MSKIRVVLSLLLSVLAVNAAISVGSASAAFLVEECANVGLGLGVYEDAHCEKPGGVDEFKWKPIAANSLFLGSSGPSILETKIAGLAIHIECLKGKSVGLAQESGLSTAELTIESCQLYELPSGGGKNLICAIPNIVANLHSIFVGQLTFPLQLSLPASGTNFTTVKFTGCPKTIPASIEVKGTITCPGDFNEAKLLHDVKCTGEDKGLTLGKEPASIERLRVSQGAERQRLVSHVAADTSGSFAGDGVPAVCGSGCLSGAGWLPGSRCSL